MNIEITLGGALVKYKPQGCTGNRFTFNGTPAMKLAELLAELGIPAEQRLMCIINGSVVQSEAFGNTSLDDGDALSLVPPITAG